MLAGARATRWARRRCTRYRCAGHPDSRSFQPGANKHHPSRMWAKSKPRPWLRTSVYRRLRHSKDRRAMEPAKRKPNIHENTTAISPDLRQSETWANMLNSAKKAPTIGDFQATPPPTLASLAVITNLKTCSIDVGYRRKRRAIKEHRTPHRPTTPPIHASTNLGDVPLTSLRVGQKTTRLNY